MSENMTQFPSKFVSYPTNRLAAHFKTRESVSAVLSDAEKLGVDIGSIYILDGKEGLEALDVTGEKHGTLAKMSRNIHQAGSTTEQDMFKDLIAHLENGGISVAIHASDEKLRNDLIDIYKAHEANDIKYSARFYIEDIH